MMNKDAQIPGRKEDHIAINLNNDVASSLSTGLERYRFVHEALPEIDLADVDTSLELFGKRLAAPLLISSMTGGSEKVAQFNHGFALAAQKYGLALALGSQRAAIEDPSLAKTFQVREYAPDVLLFANLGAVQLNYGYGPDECQRAVEMIAADGLYLHLNPLQEALQAGGDSNFSGLLKKIEAVCRQVSVPVMVKEVGWGINAALARKLIEAGVAAIDVAGAGGTSWSQVEMYRQPDPMRAALAAQFTGWGIPTVECIQDLRAELPNALIFASGGLRSGLDLAKSLALGATLGGIAGPLLRALNAGHEQLDHEIALIIETLRVCMFATGKKNLAEFDQTVLTTINA